VTPTQYERLPALMREIVDTDREIEAMARSPFVVLAVAAEKRKRRAELRTAAEKLWGHRITGDRATN
jgi:hypothetical protein